MSARKLRAGLAVIIGVEDSTLIEQLGMSKDAAEYRDAETQDDGERVSPGEPGRPAPRH